MNLPSASLSPQQQAALESVRRERTRRHERHGAAAMRALSGATEAEYRGQRLLLEGRPFAFAAPYLAQNFADASLARSRGIADALALRLRHSDAELHRRLRPEQPFARVVFDILEQLRCESLVSAELVGVRENLNVAFDEWNQEALHNGFSESSLGILLFTIMHMVRARLIRNIDDEDVAASIEATRANLAPLIGHAFYQLPKHRLHQERYALHALEIANILGEMAGAEGEALAANRSGEVRGVSMPLDWDPPELPESELSESASSGQANHHDAEAIGDYRIYTREYDQVVSGADLYRGVLRARSRAELDRLVAAQAVSVTRLALRFQSVFAVPQPDGWEFGQHEGRIDARRLAQLVSNPHNHRIFFRADEIPRCDATVTFLVDNSGSMKTQRYESVAVLLDTCARALELAGVGCEVLGFSTGGWSGGRVAEQWRRDGSPEAPGRLNETLHIVYKDGDATWKSSRSSMATMLRTLHYREGVDGEALTWAAARLLARPEKRRLLIMISDGAPMDAATDTANHDGYLFEHLRAVTEQLERDPRLELACLGIDLDTSDFITRSLDVDLEGTLGNSTYRAVEQILMPPWSASRG